MYKKIIVLFLLLGTSIFVLPAESKAADKGAATIVETTLASSSALTPQRYRRRWRQNNSWRSRRYYGWNQRRYRRNNYRRSYRRVYYTPYYRRNYRRYRIY